MSAGSALGRDPVASVLRTLRAYASVEDERARERVQAREAELGARVTTAEKYALYGAAPPLAVSPQGGDLLYVLTRARRPLSAVEFGTSHGISAIYLAAALRDAGAGSLVSSELLPEKAEAARANLVAAELDDLVEIRVGDALETLRDVLRPVELVFLDGRNDLYLDVLRLLEPALAHDALVLADLSADDPDLVPYLSYVRGEGSGYASLTVPFGAGLEVSLRG
jgi:predicted O-methyltransferase YrrM